MNYTQAKAELDALPIWVRQMVSGMRGCIGYGSGGAPDVFPNAHERGISNFHLYIKGERCKRSFLDGFLHIKAIAEGLDHRKKENVSSV